MAGDDWGIGGEGEDGGEGAAGGVEFGEEGFELGSIGAVVDGEVVGGAGGEAGGGPATSSDSTASARAFWASNSCRWACKRWVSSSATICPGSTRSPSSTATRMTKPASSNPKSLPRRASITEAGKQTLLEWLAEPSDPMAIREELLVKIRGGHLVEPETMLAELRRRLAEHQEKLNYLRGVEAEHYPEPDELTGSPLMIYLTMRCGIRYQTAWVEWCREAIARLERDSNRKAGDRKGGSAGIALNGARLRNPTAAPLD
nr:hypothetical protein [Synechococcus sp. PCC 7336]